MKNQVRTMLCLVLAGFVSGGVLGCGVTNEVATTHPSMAASTAIGPGPADAPGDTAPAEGRPRTPRLVASAAPAARVVARPLAGTAPTANRSTGATAEANAIALGSPTRRIQSGRIVDEAGQPLVGATVLLKGTNRGASTDANGDYSLPVPVGINTFVFAYSGYEQEVAQSRDGQPLVVTLLPTTDYAPTAREQSTKLRTRKKHQ